jgi:hypothetical protein
MELKWISLWSKFSEETEFKGISSGSKFSDEIDKKDASDPASQGIELY